MEGKNSLLEGLLNAVSGKGEAENIKNFYSTVNKVDMILDLKKFESELRVFKKGDLVTQIGFKEDPEKYRYTFPRPGYPSVVLDFGKYGEFGGGHGDNGSCENMVVGSITPTGIHIYTVESYWFVPYVYVEGEPEANKK